MSSIGAGSSPTDRRRRCYKPWPARPTPQRRSRAKRAHRRVWNVPSLINAQYSRAAGGGLWRCKELCRVLDILDLRNRTRENINCGAKVRVFGEVKSPEKRINQLSRTDTRREVCRNFQLVLNKYQNLIMSTKSGVSRLMCGPAITDGVGVETLVDDQWDECVRKPEWWFGR